MHDLPGHRRILIYSHDTFGLGNIRRMLAIATHLVESDPQCNVLMLTGSPMLHAFRLHPRIDYVKLPCLGRTVEGEYVAKHLKMDYAKLVDLRAGIVLGSVMHFEPDFILVDKKPLGISDELAPALAEFKRAGKPARLVLLLRDILDSPAVTRKSWLKDGYFQAIDDYYDSVLVVGSREIFDAPQEYQFSRSTAKKTRFCGYIRRAFGTQSRAAMRERLGVGVEPLVLVTAGGGEDGFRLLDNYVEALRLAPAEKGFKTVLLCGPEMPVAQRQSLKARVAGLPGVIFQEFSDDMMSYMDAADVVVSMGGYNTVCEILTLKKRAIIVPRVRPVQEQWIRAQRMEQLGLIRCLHPDSLTPAILLNAVLDGIARLNVYTCGMYQLDLDALDRIAQSIQELITQRPSTIETHSHGIPLLEGANTIPSINTLAFADARI